MRGDPAGRFDLEDRADGGKIPVSEWAYRDLPHAERSKAVEADFARGWKDAMASQPEKLGQPTPYGRGHRIGLRDREYALAKKLRMSQLHNHGNRTR